MAKILISTLGTGDIIKDSDQDYEETVYRIDEKEYPDVLTAKVLVKHYDIDTVIFIGTNKSMWDNVYFHFNGSDDEYLEYISVKKSKNELNISDLDSFNNTIDSYVNGNNSKSFIIKYSENTENEIWENFELLLEIKNSINANDEIYLDITHGFRYMPILNIFLLEFLANLNGDDFTIKGIYYGMFSENKSDIINFKVFYELLEWAKAINSFKKHALVSPISELLTQDKDKSISNIFTKFSSNLQMANMSSLWSFMKDANKMIKKLKDSDNKIITLLGDDLVQLTSRFNCDKQSSFQYELSKWLFENNNYALSYIALYEAIITKSCEKTNEITNKKIDINDHTFREECKTSIGNDKYGKHFYTKYDNSLSVIRNSIVHQNHTRKDKVKQDISKLKEFILTFQSFFEQCLKGKSNA